MKKFNILIALTLTTMICLADTQNFSVTANTLWSTKNYSVNSGKASNFTITSGMTLTIDQSGVSCYECSFTGGTIAITTGFTCQSCSFSNTTMTISSAVLSLQSSVNTFSNVSLTASGTGEILANAPMTISNSVFTFNTSSYLYNNGGTLTITSSTLNFNGNSYLLANAGPVNLENASEIFVGNGASSSKAYIKMNGPTLNIYDNSGISLGNDNNYYFNWGSYTAASTNNSISTANSTINCGGSFANSCSNPLVYGPASLNASGVGTISVLPVLLTGFNAELAGTAVNITWMTEQETNSNDFEIERSVDGVKWELIGTVAAKGNSSTISDYTFTDNAPVNGINYYRLKMVNLDNSFNYSGIKIVRTTSVNKISFFPNPAQTVVNVSLVQSENQSTIQLLNISGQLLAEQKGNGGTTVSLNVQQYPRGMYVIRVVNTDGTSASDKIVIAH
jgi:hypothetical protein